MGITNTAAKTPCSKSVSRIRGGHRCITGPVSYDLTTHTLYRSYHVSKGENLLLFVYEYATQTLRANKDNGYTEQEAKDIAREVWKMIDGDSEKLAGTFITPVAEPSFNIADGDAYAR